MARCPVPRAAGPGVALCPVPRVGPGVAPCPVPRVGPSMAPSIREAEGRLVMGVWGAEPPS